MGSYWYNNCHNGNPLASIGPASGGTADKNSCIESGYGGAGCNFVTLIAYGFRRNDSYCRGSVN